MKTSIEIEFKTFITKDKYESLLKTLHQEDNILIQINHYFDTNDSLLEKEKKVLRIRQKGDQYKLTKKSKSNDGNIENHIYLEKDEAINMLDSGFNANIIGEDIDVKKVGELKTTRTKLKYKSGYIFLDKSEYNGITDYELEYEADDMKTGQIEFDEILKEFDIPFKKSYSKFKRCIETKNQG